MSEEMRAFLEDLILFNRQQIRALERQIGDFNGLLRTGFNEDSEVYCDPDAGSDQGD